MAETSETPVSNPAKPIRVMIVDDQQIIQQGLATILKYQPDIEVVGTASNGQEVIESAPGLQPDVILMDIRMPVLDGVAATARLRQLLPACRIVMLTTFNDEDYILEALRAGASGYLLKDIPSQKLTQAIQMIHAGIYQLDPEVAAKLIASLPTSLSGSNSQKTTSEIARPGTSPEIPVAKPEAKRKFDLSEREIEILRLVANGATNREIAEKLVISEGTVKNHVSNILSRLNLRDRTQAAIFGRDNGLL